MMDPVLQRAMFAQQAAQAQPQQMAMPQQQMQPDPGTGITQGLTNVAETMDEVNQAIDMADDHVGIMNALRGDDMSVEERRTELAGYVGSKDAKKTPESVLTLLQPTFTILDIAEKGEQGGQAEQGGLGMAMGTPNTSPASQQQAMDRMAMGEEPIRAYDGIDVNLKGPNYGNTSDLNTAMGNLNTSQAILRNMFGKGTSLDEFTKRRMDIINQGNYDTSDAYAMNPYIAGLQLAAAVANAPKGQLISSVLNPESIQQITDPIQEMAKAKAADKREQAQARMQAELGGLEAFEGQQNKMFEIESDITKQIIAQAIKEPNKQLIQQGGQTYIVNTDDGSVTNLEGMPVATDLMITNLGNGQVHVVDKNNAYKEDGSLNFTIQGEPKADYSHLKTLELKDGSVITVNKSTGKMVNTIPGSPDFEILGNSEDGWYRIDKNNPEAEMELLKEGTGPTIPPTELAQNIKEYTNAREALRLTKDPRKIPELLDKIEAYGKNLGIQVEGTEFERILNAQYEEVLKKGGKAAADLWKSKMMTNYLDAKTTIASDYSLVEGGDKAFGESYVDLINRATTNLDDARTLSEMASMSATLANEFGGTGALAETRLSVTKLFKLIPGLETLAENFAYQDEEEKGLFKKMVSQLANEDVAALETIDSIGARFAVFMADAFPGNLNQSEIELIIKAGPNIFTSKEGLSALAKVYERGAKKAELEQALVQSFISEAGDEDSELFGKGMEGKYYELSTRLEEFYKEQVIEDKNFTDELVDSLKEVGTVQVSEQSPYELERADGSREVLSIQEGILADNAWKSKGDYNTFRDSVITDLQNDPNMEAYRDQIIKDGIPNDEMIRELFKRFDNGKALIIDSFYSEEPNLP